VGGFLVGEAFDGANIWVANLFDNTMTKLRAWDGTILGTFAWGPSSCALAFDGANIRAVDRNGTIKVRATGVHSSETFAVGKFPVNGVAFDGANIWVTKAESDTVSKI
jgi:hypothetical protein